MIELSASLSNRILRKGDVFNIDVDVNNISDKPITIVNVKLVSPLGFIQYKKEEMPMSVWDRIRGVLDERRLYLSTVSAANNNTCFHLFQRC